MHSQKNSSFNCPEEDSFRPPDDTSLPFVSYGIFQPGELGFLRIGPLVADVQPIQLQNQLLIREGLPILDYSSKGKTHAYMISFHKSASDEAYKTICDLEPKHQYRWDLYHDNSLGKSANILVGRHPREGSIAFSEYRWTGKNDPLFTIALEVIQETLDHFSNSEGMNLKPMMHLQMAYLLLWSAIERYASLRYSLAGGPMKKILRISEEPAFICALREAQPEPRIVYRADRPSNRVTLNPDDPKESMEYYYQVRSNIAHAGKSAEQYHMLVQSSLSELLEIFRCVLKSAWKECEFKSI